MNVVIVGAGPAGLYLAWLLKSQSPQDRVRVFERNAANVTYGWGVVFSGRALGFIADRSPLLFDDISRSLERWDDLTIVHRDQPVVIDGSSFSGISRQRLLKVLQQHCYSVGVELNFESPLANIPSADQADLVVGADGANSMVRERHRNEFSTSTEHCTNRYIWYGTSRVFETLSLIFRSNEHGVFVAHTYRYSVDKSTFLVECDAQTFEKSGLAEMSDAQSRAYCESVFADDLNNQPLLSNHSAWCQFPIITNGHWFNNRTILIGDALRTVHFSIGSGTRTAMQDAIVLADCVAESSKDVDIALQNFVRARSADVDKLSRIATESIRWYENFRDIMSLDAWQFAMHYMLRGGELNLDLIEQRAPRFASDWRARNQHS